METTRYWNNNFASLNQLMKHNWKYVLLVGSRPIINLFETSNTISNLIYPTKETIYSKC